MRQLLKNITLSLAFVVLTLFILEYSLALFVDVTDDIEYEHLPKVGLRLKSGQHGIYIRSAIKDGDPIKAHFHINNDGFNNLHDYSKERPISLMFVSSWPFSCLLLPSRLAVVNQHRRRPL